MSEFSHLKAKVARGELLREDEWKLIELYETLTARNAEQAAEIERLEELVFAYESVQAPVNPLLIQVSTLTAALEKYGRHEYLCVVKHIHKTCTCGFKQALSERGK